MHRQRASTWTILFPILTACTGTIGGGDPQGSGGDDDAASALCKSHEPFVRRLTAREYRAEAVDLFGPSIEGAFEVPPDSYLDGFDNQAPTLGVSTLHVEAYLEGAANIAAVVRQDDALRDAVFGCGALAAPDSACLDAFASRFGRRVYRRPLEQEEIDALLSLAAEGTGDPDPWRGATLMLEGMLQSPMFLYRSEIGVEDPSDSSVRRLTPFEIASRLSFLIWQAGPNDWLLDRAADGALDDADGIEATALEMLDDPRAKDGLAAFTEQWLRLPLLAQASRSTAQFPAWSEDLRASMLEETRRLLADYTWDDELPFLGALTAPYTYVDDELASLYGLDKTEPGWVRVDLASDATRRGLLTHASLLTLAQSSETTAPILRGKLVRDVLLCTPVPPPPQGVPDIPEAEPGETLRSQLARHRTDPACSSCHDKMDPIGFGFERYDLIGGFREVDAAGNPLSGEGEVVDIEGGAFRGPIELGARLAEAEETEVCVMRHLFRFAAGRSEEPSDSCAVEDLATAFAETGGNLRGALVALVRSEGFRRVGGNQ